MRQNTIVMWCVMALALTTLLLQSGCDSGGYVDPDPVGSFVTRKKNQVFYALTDGKKSTEEAEESAAFLLEIFEESDLSQAGPNESTFEELRTGAQELQSMLQSSPAQSEVNTKIDELLALTESLPGEIEPLED